MPYQVGTKNKRVLMQNSIRHEFSGNGRSGEPSAAANP